MHPQTLFTSLAFLLSAVSVPTLACKPPAQSGDSNSPLTIGDDGPADPETLGYSVNHFSLNSNNLTATQEFYGGILGMRHLFTYHASEDMAVMYMGYPEGGKNGTGFQTGQQMLDEKNNREGLIEFVYIRGQERLTASSEVPNTFSHIGLIVPDIKATQERMDRMGAKIVKRIGKKPKVQGLIANAYGMTDLKKAKAALPGILQLGFTEFLIVADPDGNLFEVQQQVGGAF
jgi:lactoylglutathione lyase